MMYGFIYLNDYKIQEEKYLRDNNIPCVRFHESDIISENINYKKFLIDECTYQIRTNRLTIDEYTNIWEKFNKKNIKITTNPISYETISDFDKQYEILQVHSPKSIILDANLSKDEIYEKLELSNIKYPLFFRTEVESAAKYVGFEGCVVYSKDKKTIEEKINNIKEHIVNYKTIIVKEMLELAIDKITNNKLEFRVIAINGDIISYDYNKKNFTKNIYDLKLDVFAKAVLNTLLDNDINGGIFLDIALTLERVPIVVECKNLTNGTILDIEEVKKNILLKNN